jgi:DNA-binding NarL/FixJ family response regulator
MANVRIFLADGHDVVRRGLASLLSSHAGWSICGEARTSPDTVRLVLKLKPDIVIIGQDMFGLNGIDATRRIIQARPSTEVLFYTVHDEEYLIVQAIRAGARGHVLKSDPENTLIEAITALGKHSPYFSTRASETLLDQLLKAGNTSDDSVGLTDREREIVRHLADGTSNKEIAYSLKISIKTVEAHRGRIMHKLGFTSITELVRYAIRNRIIEP